MIVMVGRLMVFVERHAKERMEMNHSLSREVVDDCHDLGVTSSYQLSGMNARN